LLHGQRPDGRFENSEFELNPGRGGTPHEAAADVGLIAIGRALRDQGIGCWRTYVDAAERNLRDYHLRRLWSESEQRFRDSPNQSTYVPNKAATIVEALCHLAEITGREEYLSRYVRPTVDAILAHQVNRSGKRLDGAIAQNSFGRRIV